MRNVGWSPQEISELGVVVGFPGPCVVPSGAPEARKMNSLGREPQVLCRKLFRAAERRQINARLDFSVAPPGLSIFLALVPGAHAPG